MTNKQSEAMRLADDLDAEFAQGRISNHSGRKAAAELRQQHATLRQALEALEAKGDAWVVLERKAIASIKERLK